MTANLKTQNGFLKYSKNVYLFISGVFIAGIVSTALQGTFHNYLNDMFGIGADQRGFLEFPRELPGLLATFIIGAIIFMGEIKILSLAIFLTGFGLFSLGYLSSNFYAMIFFMTLWSTGAHLHLSLMEPVAIDLSRSGKKGYVLGRINAVRSSGVILGTLLIWFFMGVLKVSYARMYLGAFILCIIAAILYSMIRIKESNRKPSFKIVLKKKYSLFYILAAIFGVRKQLFLVFGPWLLIKFYGQRPENLARLLLISAAIGIFIKPYLGRIIDRFGERIVLIIDAVLIFVLSSVYAAAPALFDKEIALIILYCCFVLDELLFSLRAARTTYLYKILDRKEDFTPTISMGLSIEHIVSMTAPLAAGFIWIKFGYHWVFVIAAAIAVLSGFVSLRIPTNIKSL